MTLSDVPPASTAWLDDRRRAAAQRLGEPSLPTTDEEVWRYSRIDELQLTDWSAPSAPARTDLPPAVAELLSTIGERAATVVLCDGFVVHAEISPHWADHGVFAGRILDAPAGAEAALGAVAGEGVDVFGPLNDARTADPVLVHVPAGVVLDRPVVVVDWIEQEGIAVHPRLVVHLGRDAEATVLEWQGSAAVAALSLPLVELDLEAAARLHHGSVQMRGEAVWQIATQLSRVATDATLDSTQVALGADYGRTRTDCRLVGRGATGDLRAVYFGAGTQTLDFRTFQQHAAPDTTSNLMFKGVVDDHSRSVYTGLIKVEKDARGTNAFQTNRNIKLSDHAWAESVPNLEIETNDVRCSHASTVGPIDEDQRFYLESRGVRPEVADRLIVAGFFDEVLESFPVPEVVATVDAVIQQRLDRGAGPR